ncbi:MAG: hypothetical protein K2I42_06100 [Anaeroplasmataceae bacterium]|nr:hypothetical protein [Anaeroplasmataceae bacterium]
MVYNILGIIIGLLVLINIIMTIVNRKKEKLYITIINIITALLFLATGISGFFIPEKYEYISFVLLLVLSVFYLSFFFIVSKKNNNSNKKKENART